MAQEKKETVFFNKIIYISPKIFLDCINNIIYNITSLANGWRNDYVDVFLHELNKFEKKNVSKWESSHRFGYFH